METPRLLLVRHGRAVEVDGRCIGHTDVALSAAGAAQVAALAARWHPGSAVHMVTSDLRRAHETARILAQQWGCAIDAVDPRWRELDFGAWDGQRWDVLEATEGPALTAWMADWVERAPPGGERVEALAARVGEAVEAALATAAAGGADTLLVVTHAGAMRAALEVLVGWPRALWFRCTLDYGHLIELRRVPKGEWSIARLNAEAPSAHTIADAFASRLRTD